MNAKRLELIRRLRERPTITEHVNPNQLLTQRIANISEALACILWDRETDLEDDEPVQEGDAPASNSDTLRRKK